MAVLSVASHQVQVEPIMEGDCDRGPVVPNILNMWARFVDMQLILNEDSYTPRSV